MSLKLLTLNMEHDRHLLRVRAAIAAHLPDIVCLQEVMESDCPRLAAVGNYEVKYAVSTRMPAGSAGDAVRLRNWGVAVLTRMRVRRQEAIYYSADLCIREFRQPNDPCRVLVVTELEYRGQPYRIATTHFTWSPGGRINDEQRADFARLKQALAPYSQYVLCGDFNAPRGREMFAKFTDELDLIDHLPQSITTTIDPGLHYAGALELVVDTVFATRAYQVRDVQVLEGISDHKGILATLERQ